jgi:hypothetical protein
MPIFRPPADRQADRYQVTPKNADLTILLRQLQGSDDSTVESELHDVSDNGIKLSVTQPITFGELVEVQFQSPSLGIDFPVEAEVRWIRQGDNTDAWIVGLCAVEGTMIELLEQLSSAGIIERRRTPRDNVAYSATVKWEANPVPVDVSLLNASSNGICFQSDEPGYPGRRLRLNVDAGSEKANTLMAVAKWCVQSKDGYLIGCSVDYMPTCLAEPKPAITPKPKRLSRGMLPRLAAGCAAIVSRRC